MRTLGTSFLEAGKCMIMTATTVGQDVMQNITGEQDTSMSPIVTSLSKTGNGFIYIGILCLAILAVISLLIASGKIMIGSNVTKVDGKNSLIWTIIAAVAGFSAISLIGYAAIMSSSFFG